MATIAPPAPVEGEQFCYRHPKRATLLSCGHCGKPVCTDCVKLGPAGPRCPDCAKSSVAFRPGAVFYEIQRALGGFIGGASRSWYGWMVLLALIGLLGKGCTMVTEAVKPRPSQPIKAPRSEE